MKKNDVDFSLDDRKLKKAYRKAKIKSTIRTIVIVILVVIPLFIVFTKINVMVTYKMGTAYYDEVQKALDVTKPNAYVSQANDTIGIFGASGQYTVSKKIGGKSIVLYNENSRYGFADFVIPNRFIMGAGWGGGQAAGEWPVSFDKSGNLSMMAFHPDIKYKEYKDDLSLLSKISSDSLVEMTLSFDKKYKAEELLSILPNAKISEILIDGYTVEQMDKYKMEASQYDGKAAFIQEYDFIRVGVSSMINYDAEADITENYSKYLEKLQYNYKYTYYKDRFKELYNTLKSKGELEGKNVDIIGVVVYGNTDELKQLKSNPHIKASSVGIVTKDVIFK